MPNSASGGLATTPSINRPKRAMVQGADNGFVVSLDHTNDYEQSLKIATNGAEVADIISAYFAE